MIREKGKETEEGNKKNTLQKKRGKAVELSEKQGRIEGYKKKSRDQTSVQTMFSQTASS